MTERIVLFAGDARGRWRAKKGDGFGWRVVDGALEVSPGQGDIFTEERFGDHHLHLEFWLPHLPHAQGQARANSGVYLQGRYELQILDSFGKEQPESNDCGAIYKVAPPLVNACGRPEQWQTLEVAFRAPRPSPSSPGHTPALITAFLNGELIHHAVEVWKPTGGGLEEASIATDGPLLLQDHGDRVRFRNIWARRVLAQSTGQRS